MTPQQALSELQKEVGINERLARLLRIVAKDKEFEALRDSYKSYGDHAGLLSCVAKAKAIADFVKLITAQAGPSE